MKKQQRKNVYDLILGKPKNYENALEMLTMLNGKTHKVVTSVCIIDTETNKMIVKSETSEVTFEQQENDKLEYYIENYKPFDKAGSYGIQELPEGFIKNINGDFNNIVGFPTSLLEKMLLEMAKNINLKQTKQTELIHSLKLGYTKFGSRLQ